MSKEHELIRIALAAYEDACMRGLCAEGAMEAARGAAQGVDLKLLTREIAMATARTFHQPHIGTKRIYDKPAIEDGVRVLVDRLWPRGISKNSAQLDDWLKDLAPSNELRRWFSHDPDRWNEFQKRYHLELDHRSKQITHLLELARDGALTLVYAAKDEQRNNAVALRHYLMTRSANR